MISIGRKEIGQSFGWVDGCPVKQILNNSQSTKQAPWSIIKLAFSWELMSGCSDDSNMISRAAGSPSAFSGAFRIKARISDWILIDGNRAAS